MLSNAPATTTYMMYGYVKTGYPLNALWGFQYGGIVEERPRSSSATA